MKKASKKIISALAITLLASQASAALLYDQNVSAGIQMGSGIANGSWTIDNQNGFEIALRAKLRFDSNNNPQNIFNSNGDGTYSFMNSAPPTGYAWAPGSPSTSLWNYEFSVDTSGANNPAANYFYVLSVDYDPSMATNFFSYDAVNLPGAGNGGGANVQQNSWNMQFLDNPLLGNPLAGSYSNTDHGTYDLVFSVYDNSTATTALASTRIQIIQGNGATSVPEPAGLLLMALGLVGLGRRRFKA